MREGGALGVDFPSYAIGLLSHRKHYKSAACQLASSLTRWQGQGKIGSCTTMCSGFYTGISLLHFQKPHLEMG